MRLQRRLGALRREAAVGPPWAVVVAVLVVLVGVRPVGLAVLPVSVAVVALHGAGRGGRGGVLRFSGTRKARGNRALKLQGTERRQEQ